MGIYVQVDYGSSTIKVTSERRCGYDQEQGERRALRHERPLDRMGAVPAGLVAGDRRRSITFSKAPARCSSATSSSWYGRATRSSSRPGPLTTSGRKADTCASCVSARHPTRTRIRWSKIWGTGKILNHRAMYSHFRARCEKISICGVRRGQGDEAEEPREVKETFNKTEARRLRGTEAMRNRWLRGFFYASISSITSTSPYPHNLRPSVFFVSPLPPV